MASVKDRFQITGEAGARLLHECALRPAWFSNPAPLNDGREVAVFRRQLWALAPTWEAGIEGSDFQLRRKILSFHRRNMVQGGPFAGAKLTGSLFDMRFELTRAGEILAQARLKRPKVRDRHDIEIVNVTPQTELLMAIMIANLLVQQNGTEPERRSSHSHSPD